MILCANEISYPFLVMSSFRGDLLPDIENQILYFHSYRLFYDHCFVNDDFEIIKNIMICQEIHESFVNKMNERPVVLVPWGCH